MININTYYQPKMSEENDFLEGELYSFEVYVSRKTCQEDFPNEEIVEYHNDDIENKVFVDLRTSVHFFGLHDSYKNISSFTCFKHTDNENFTDYEFDFKAGIRSEDEDIIKEICVDLIGFGSQKEFDSINGNTYIIVKLTEEEYHNFLF